MVADVELDRETIEMLPPADPCPLLLLLPPFGCPTGAVYDAFDQTLAGSAHDPDYARVRALTQLPLHPQSKLFNDLADPACRVGPKLRRVLDAAMKTGHRAHVTGSGAALFILADTTDASTLAEQRRAIENATACAVILTYTAG